MEFFELEATHAASPISGRDFAKMLADEFADAFVHGCYVYFSPFIGFWKALQTEKMYSGLG